MRAIRRNYRPVPRHVRALLALPTAAFIGFLVAHGSARFVWFNVMYIALMALTGYRWLTPWGRGEATIKRL